VKPAPVEVLDDAEVRQRVEAGELVRLTGEATASAEQVTALRRRIELTQQQARRRKERQRRRAEAHRKYMAWASQRMRERGRPQ
jgi:hypothetical protein